MECAQLDISGGGSAQPATVSFPGAYAGSDPGITINIYQTLTNYTIPGTYFYSSSLPSSSILKTDLYFILRSRCIHLLKHFGA